MITFTERLLTCHILLIITYLYDVITVSTHSICIVDFIYNLLYIIIAKLVKRPLLPLNFNKISRQKVTRPTDRQKRRFQIHGFQLPTPTASHEYFHNAKTTTTLPNLKKIQDINY